MTRKCDDVQYGTHIIDVETQETIIRVAKELDDVPGHIFVEGNVVIAAWPMLGVTAVVDLEK